MHKSRRAERKRVKGIKGREDDGLAGKNQIDHS